MRPTAEAAARLILAAACFLLTAAPGANSFSFLRRLDDGGGAVGGAGASLPSLASLARHRRMVTIRHLT